MTVKEKSRRMIAAYKQYQSINGNRVTAVQGAEKDE